MWHLLQQRRAFVQRFENTSGFSSEKAAFLLVGRGGINFAFYVVWGYYRHSDYFYDTFTIR